MVVCGICRAIVFVKSIDTVLITGKCIALEVIVDVRRWALLVPIMVERGTKTIAAAIIEDNPSILAATVPATIILMGPQNLDLLVDGLP